MNGHYQFGPLCFPSLNSSPFPYEKAVIKYAQDESSEGFYF